MWLKELIKKIIYKERYSSETFVEFLKSGGAKIGNNVIILDPRKTVIDYGNRMLIEIGDNVLVTAGCTILAHDYSYSVSRYAYGKMPQVTKRTKIGNNVFLGMNSIVLMGAEIGNNVIIGAGSVVHGVIESDSIYAGNPARKISSLEDYTNKNLEKQIDSAVLWANSFVEAYGRIPTIVEMGFYKWMFFEKTDENMRKYYLGDPFFEYYLKMPKMFNSVDELIENITSV